MCVAQDKLTRRECNSLVVITRQRNSIYLCERMFSCILRTSTLLLPIRHLSRSRDIPTKASQILPTFYAREILMPQRRMSLLYCVYGLSSTSTNSTSNSTAGIWIGKNNERGVISRGYIYTSESPRCSRRRYLRVQRLSEQVPAHAAVASS